MASIFSRIIQGDLPAYKVAENDHYLAFLDVFPLVKGHTLVIPKPETDDIFDLSPGDFSGLFAFAQQVGLAIRASIPCVKVGIAVVGLEVPHAHIHLVPLQEIGDLNFMRPKLQLAPEEMEIIRQKIAGNFR
ncbi:MAG: HIT family protein [Bacteroidia bacterium]|jgi:histidine triad (HIT) family protein|nr:HIT family protein [Bacteroidia bacterium]MCC6768937.1 HIT family protein [Bacteroidia bacterium]